jgi:hypothetical protein
MFKDKFGTLADDFFRIIRVLRVEAGTAQVIAVQVGHGAFHPLHGDVMQTVGANVFANFFFRMGRRNQFLADRRVNAVVAGIRDCRGRNADVYLPGTGVPQHFDDLAACRTADDGIVHHNYRFPGNDRLDRIQFQADSVDALGLGRLNERPADIPVSSSSLP